MSGSSPPRKRAKSDKGILFDDCPRAINVTEFVEARALEITQLLAVVNNTTLPAGEVAQGPRTFVQRLPRHMRRRAMSYNIKRLPRRLRSMAKRTIDESKHRKKPPSRRWRRRPQTLLQEYQRRQRKFQWLSTHIWHAKRFQMTELYGWRIPYRSYQRGFRASYRDAMHHCVVQDHSFYACFELEGPEEVLMDRLNTLCHPRISQTFSNSKALSGCFEGTAILYEPGRYPLICIGPVQFIYRPKNGEAGKRCLWIFTHPALESQLHGVLERLFSPVSVDSNEKEQGVENGQNSVAGDGQNSVAGNVQKPQNPELVVDSKVSSPVQSHASEGSPQISLRILKQKLARFRLTGPKSGAILAKVLHEPRKQNLSFINATTTTETVQTQWDSWKRIYSNLDPGRVPPGLVCSLIVMDPRIFTDYKKSLPSLDDYYLKELPPPPCCLPNSPIWSEDVRRVTVESKIADSELNELRRTNVSIDLESVPNSIMDKANVIPILLVHQRASCNQDHIGMGSGWDLILPSAWAMPFWTALQYATARAVGLEFERNFSRTSYDQISGFPHLWPDTVSGQTVSRDEEEQLKNRSLRRPKNRRVNYEELRITHPFKCPWNELISGWRRLSKNHGRDGTVYVLRDRILLRKLDKSIRKEASMNVVDSVCHEHSSSLVAVRITAVGKGVPKPRALLCIPTVEDFQKILARNTLNLPESATQAERVLERKNSMDQVKKTNPMEADVTGEKEFIAFSSQKRTETELDLDAFFSNPKDARKVEKKEKEKIRKRTKRQGVKVEDREKVKDSVKVASYENIVDSCRRRIFGYVMDGDFSLASGQGEGIAFCSVLGLRDYLASGNKDKNGQCYVLYRNVQSRYYRAARMTILGP